MRPSPYSALGCQRTWASSVGGMVRPKHCGQSGHPMPLPVMRTMLPARTTRNAETKATRAVRRIQRGRGWPGFTVRGRLGERSAPLGRPPQIQAFTDVLYGGDEGFWFDQARVVDHNSRVDALVRIEVDVGAGHAGQVVQVLADFGDASDFTHHPGNGQFSHGLFHLSCPVHMGHFHITGLATCEPKCAQSHPGAQGKAPSRGETFIICLKFAVKVPMGANTAPRGC